MIDDELLREVAQYKQPRCSSASIGELLLQWSASQSGKDSSPVNQVASMVDRIIGEPFKGHCRVVNISGGVLTICVDDPGMVYLLRRAYLFDLREQLNELLPGRDITDIRFLTDKS